MEFLSTYDEYSKGCPQIAQLQKLPKQPALQICWPNSSLSFLPLTKQAFFKNLASKILLLPWLNTEQICELMESCVPTREPLGLY